MSDLIQRLRRQLAKLEEVNPQDYLVMDLMDQAAERIAKLEGLCRMALKDQHGWSNRMREALQQDHDCEDHVCGPCIRCGAPQCCPICCMRRAIAALQEGDKTIEDRE